jgi:methyl-accepting chemotaxis protein/methyl-accepting chemotaxis protein-1 (serine sensor receptor)
MGSWTIGKKLYAVVGALGVLLGIGSGFAMWSGSNLDSALETALTKTTKKIELALRLQKNALEVRSEQRRELLAGFGNDKAVFEQAQKSLDETFALTEERLKQIEPLLVTAEGKKLVADIAQANKDWKIANEDVEKLIQAGKTMDAWTIAKERCNPLVDKVDEYTKTLLEQQDAFLAKSEEQAGTTSAMIRYVMFAIVFFSLVIVAGAVWIVRGTNNHLRKVAGELKDGAQQVESAAGQVATSAQSLSQGATEQASSLEETSASMEEMASMTRRNAENAVQAASLVSEVTTQVHQSNTALKEMVGSMDAIRESSRWPRSSARSPRA